MAEATAVAAVMQVALQVHVQRLRVHSDCVALVQLWLERREDPRLHTIRKLAAQFRWFELCSVPRLHNQPADRLAKRMLEKFTTSRLAPWLQSLFDVLHRITSSAPGCSCR